MQYPKTFNNNSWLVSDVQSGNEVDEECMSGSDAGQTNLIVNYLPNDMSEDELLNLFCKIGEIVKHKIVRDRRSGHSLGYGFVEFKNPNAARIAQIMRNQFEIRGKSLKVAFARPQSEDISNANLYVAYLPPDMDESKLATLFGCYGTIIEVKILRCKFTGRSRGAGFVRFDQRMAAEVAKKALDNYFLNGAKRSITVQYANGSMKPPMQEQFCLSAKNEAFNGVPMKRQIDPETQPAYPLPPKRQMQPVIEPTANCCQEPYPFPPPVKRHFEPKIQQRQVGPGIQQHPENQTAVKRSQAPNPYPWLDKRPMPSDVQQRQMDPRMQQHQMDPGMQQSQMDPGMQQSQMSPRMQQRQMGPGMQQRQMGQENQPGAKRSQAPIPC